MDWCHYRFRSTWRLAAPPDAVYRVLERPQEYPRWWPQVREVRQTGETTGVLRFRSLLPFDLLVTARTTRQDPDRRVLEAALRGDLEGWVRWTVQPAGDGDRPGGGPEPAATGRTALLFEEEAVVRKPLLRALSAPGRPLALANHAWMMQRGRRGLRARLAESPG